MKNRKILSFQNHKKNGKVSCAVLKKLVWQQKYFRELLLVDRSIHLHLGSNNKYAKNMRGKRNQKMSVFVQAQGIKTVYAGRVGVKKGQNSAHVVVEWPLRRQKLVFQTFVDSQKQPLSPGCSFYNRGASSWRFIHHNLIESFFSCCI